jgi:uncharacterized protein (DUF1810 family)
VMQPGDPYDLQRFVDAQDLEQVRSELRAGRKQSHWMWFVFPQLKGLEHSSMANRYGIAYSQKPRRISSIRSPGRD